MRVCPFPGLVAYEESDADRFFGREAETRIVTDNLRASPLTILYGASGAGKSSLLRAGVYHTLKSDAQAALARAGPADYVVVVHHTWRNQPAAAIAAAVRREVASVRGQPVPEENAAGPAEQFWSLPGDSESELLLILDQFEEYFQYHCGEEFLDQLCAMLAERAPVHLLIALREEALSSLDPLRRRISNAFDNLVRIDHLNREAAADAIRKPLARTGMGIDDALCLRVVEEIARKGSGVVQAPFLQLVMKRWWEEEDRARSDELRQATLSRLGGIDRIIEAHFDETIRRLKGHERAVAAQIFRGLVTTAGRKIAKTISELASEGQLDPADVRAVADALVASRILTPVPPPAGSAADDKCYQFAQDRLAARALEWRRKQEVIVARARQRRAHTAALVMLCLFLIASAAAAVAWYEVKQSRAGELSAAALESLAEDPERSILLAMHAVRETYANRFLRLVVPVAEDTLHRVLLDSPFRLTWRYGEKPVTA